MRQQAGLSRGIATLFAALFTLGRSYRRFDWGTGEDERHKACTSDGWHLSLYRYRAAAKAHRFPVICSHGMAGSHFIFDLRPQYSLARYLARQGFDTWLVDLRGRGDSWPNDCVRGSLQWNFDDFVERDLPAAVEYVCQATQSPQVFWLGMEMSGQAPFGGGARLAGPVLAYGGFAVLESSFRPCNTDPLVVARYFRNGIPDEATDLVDQFASWIQEQRMRSRDASIIYSERLADVRLPLLVLTASRDLQRPPESTRAGFEAFGSTDKTFLSAGVANGFSVDFGHDDLLAGLAAPGEVFPRIAGWLAERS